MKAFLFVNGRWWPKLDNDAYEMWQSWGWVTSNRECWYGSTYNDQTWSAFTPAFTRLVVLARGTLSNGELRGLLGRVLVAYGNTPHA